VGHVAVGLAARRLGAGALPPAKAWKFALAFACLSMFPDIDVLGFWMGVRYGSPFGHRGASHSIVVALVAGLLFSRMLRIRKPWLVALTVAVALSHGALDALTDGGLGVEFYWPFSYARYFFPWRIIPVSHIGASAFSASGWGLIGAEAIRFAPLFFIGLLPRRKSHVKIMCGAAALALTAVVAYAYLRRAHRDKLVEPNPCAGRPDEILVRAEPHILFLCEQGTAVEHYPVRLGRNGVGKHRIGDAKTPSGTYALATPDPSELGLFIHVGYPTPAQRAEGYTGGDIGIHGPHRIFAHAGILNVLWDGSNGCIGVSSDADIFEIADWLFRRDVHTVEIH
jgi:inner membrane protein